MNSDNKKKKSLYVCSSYYQVFLTLLKILSRKERADICLEIHGVETAVSLSDSLIRISGVEKVYVVPTTDKVYPYIQRNASFIPWQRRRLVRHVDKIFEGKFDKDKYDEINIYWDLSYVGTYLNIKKIHYILHEDSLNSYKHIKKNRPNYSYIYSRPRIKFQLKKLFGIVIPFGYSKYCDVIEVNDIEGIEIPTDKVRQVVRKDIENTLTREEKKSIFSAFFSDEKKEGVSGEEKRVLILTEPFFLTGRLPSKEAQIKLYEDIIDKYKGEGRIYIKAHPRDNVKYEEYFKEAVVMQKNVPTEVLNFDENFKFEKAITVTSSAVQGIDGAKEKLYLGPEFLEIYKKY